MHQHLRLSHDGELLMNPGLGEVVHGVLLVVGVGVEPRLGPHLQAEDAALLIVGAARLHPHLGDAFGDRRSVLKTGRMAN